MAITELQRLFHLARRSEVVAVAPPPPDGGGFDPTGYTLLSTTLAGMASGADLMVMSPTKMLVDLKMIDAKPLGRVMVHAGGELRFDPRVDTRLLCKGLMADAGSVITDG